MCLRRASPTGSPIEGLGGQSTKAHLGALAWGLASAVRALCTHPDLLRRWERHWIHPVRHSRSPHRPDRGLCRVSTPSPSGGRAGGLPAGGAQALARVGAMMRLMRKRFRNGLWISFQKQGRRKKKKKTIRLQSLFGEYASEGNLHAMETNPRSPVSAY